MSPSFEAYLARIYTDEGERALFLAEPRSRASAAGLSSAEVDALAAIDRDGLLLAAESFARKRDGRFRDPGLRLCASPFGRAHAGHSARESRG